MTRPVKVVLASAGVLVALAVAAAVALPLLVDAERLRPRVEAEIGRALGRRVSLGHLSLSVWSGLALRAERLRVGEPVTGSASGAVIVEGGETAVHVAWLPLLRRDVQARSITLRDARISQDGVPLVSDLHVRSKLRLAPDGSMESGGTVEGALDAFTARPRMKTEFAAMLHGGTLELRSIDATVGPMRLTAKGTVSEISSESPRVSLDGSAQLARSRVDGTFELRMTPQRPSATFEVSAPLLDVDEIMTAVSGFAGNAPPARAGSILAPPAAAAERTPPAGGPSFVRRMDASGRVRAARCVVHGIEMTDLSTRVALERGGARFDETAFSLYGGRARGTIAARPFEPEIPFTLEQSAEGVAIRPLLAALAPAQAKTVDGRASLDLRVTGRAGGRALLASMNGAGQLAIRDGRIASIGVIKQVMKAMEIAGAKGFAKDETPFEHLSAHFDLRDGVATTKDLEFRSPDLDFDGGGTVGLGGAVKLDVLASFSKVVSADLVAKTRALEVRQAPDGRVTVPLQIRGTISEPRVQLDLQRVLNEGLVRELKKQGTKSLLNKILGR